VQSKGLVDIVQMECLCQSSSVIKVISSPNEGRIWFVDGEIIDAVTQGLTGEEALKRIISWRTGNFEILAPDLSHPRTIQKNSQSLLLEAAQKLDEIQTPVPLEEGGTQPRAGMLASALSGIHGVDFALLFAFKSATELEILDSWAVEYPQPLVEWAGKTCADMESLGDQLQGGNFTQFIGLGLQCHTALLSRGDHRLCVGINRALGMEEVRETVNNIGCRWDF
jgi:hypothetical protein